MAPRIGTPVGAVPDGPGPAVAGPAPVSLLTPGGGAGPGEERATRRRGRVRVRGPLPLVQVPVPRSGTAVYGVTVLDCHGRIADRLVLRALGWAPGIRLEIIGDRRLVTVRAAAESLSSAQTGPRAGARAARSRVTPQGHVRLPAEVRHGCGVAAGDRVLLIADPAAGVLRVVPPATLDDLVCGLTTGESTSPSIDTDATSEGHRLGPADVASRRGGR
jgi:bifunctional DNA-binding transcriptional regulator/antitoxin component of YhaV-PrlF toxin-antitoxin module